MKEITRVGVDLAKKVFEVCGVDASGEVVLRRRLTRGRFLKFFAKLPPCLVGMEACGGAHHWGRQLEQLGHRVGLMAPQYVRPYRKQDKNDRTDAEAICEAVGRPNMHFVPIKDEAQQAILVRHRVRALRIKWRTALINQFHGLLAEFGLVFPTGGSGPVYKHVPAILEDGENGLPDSVRGVFAHMLEELRALEAEIAQQERELAALARQASQTQALQAIPGVGPLTASAAVAMIGDGHQFQNGRQVANWLGLVPRHRGTGGRNRLGRIHKRGDAYLRTLLVNGARSALSRWQKQAPDSPIAHRILALAERAGFNKAVVALAARNARVIWAMLYHQTEYRPA